MMAGLWHRVSSLFIPASFGPEGSELSRRGSVAVLFSFLLAAVGLAGVCMQLAAGTRAQGELDALLGALGLLVPLVLRFSGSLLLAGNLLAAIVAGTFATLSWITAGETLPPFFAFAVLPMVAVLVAGRTSGIVWGALSCGFLVALHLLISSGLEPRVPITPENIYVMKFVGTAVLCCALLVFTLAYESQNRKALQLLRAARATAESASAAKGRFLANMSHEIRTPIHGLLGMTELLLDTRLEADQRELAEMVRRSAHALRDVVNDVLDMSKVETGRIAIESIAFDLDDVLRLVQDVFGVRASESRLTLEVRRDPSVPAQLRGDPARLRQVLLNLTGNAVKFTERGAVRVAVSASPRADRAYDVAFTVEDTGVGIPEAQAATLFEEPAEVSGPGHGGASSSGLGLRISHHLVALMGGTLSLRSRPGEGSTFCFTLPLVAAEGVVEPDSNPWASGAGSLVERITGRVLVVEDQAVNRTLVVRLLEKLGCRIDTAENGREAVAAIAKREYDLVLMDCEMPEMDGFEATAEVRRLEPAGRHLPIVALTAKALMGDRERCLAAGMDDYLSKPIQREQLEALVRRFLGA
jgi:signal transduction histidine kinase